ncbi:unnamed protein product [Camellia sinensis]
MGSSLHLFLFMHVLFLSLSCFHLITIMANSLSAEQPLCHADESSALLQFKQSFSIDKSTSSDPSAYLKVASWKLEGDSGNCCSWDGVKCDEDTGHVIGLDLSSSFLHGSINSSSSLFSLVHLQRLNLAYNDFDYSRIPSEISHLSGLVSLNLSSSVFSGQIPLEISKLSNLVSIDLSFNVDSSNSGLLKLEKPGLRSLLQNLTNLKVLRLNDVSISSEVPDTLANLTSLTTLVLENCGLRGEFPISIFYLPKLQVLNVRFNKNLTGHLPKFHPVSPLQYLTLSDTSFSGKLPDSIGNLHFLNVLNFSDCYFSGSLPVSLGNLTQLNYMSLSSNQFNVGTLPFLGKLIELTELHLSEINLYGSIPSFLSNLTQLTLLNLSSNHLSGELTSQLTNLTHLISLDLDDNQLQGSIPRSFFELKNLEIIHLASNNLGNLQLENFLMLGKLSYLDLSINKLTVSSKTTSNNTLPRLKVLILDTCNLMEFPNFLRFQDRLEVLSLVGNKIYGQIPAWMLNTSVETLEVIRFQENFLTGFEQHPDIIPWDNLIILHLSHNMIKGPLPIPPLSTQSYRVAYNGLTGELPPLICRLCSLYTLGLSNNNFTGTIPPCLSNLSSLLVLNLKDNNFQGPIPHSYKKGNKLKMIDFSGNKLQGKVPRSLASCIELGILDLSHNLIEDTFPFWLGDLTKLQVLILRSNKFYGAIESPKIKLGFPNLRIIDLSHNGFTGNLPAKYFQNWIAMKFFDVNKTTYLYAPIEFPLNISLPWISIYYFEMNITIKGVNLEYKQILNIFTAIDLSSNKFEGEIPEFIGNLKGLQVLNLSNNDLSSRIPSCLGNLTNLESLDLSQNKLSGEIPQQLALLTFLEFLNVSNNNLTGPIPHGMQLNTFENNSYEGNLGLCGDPLSRKCGKPKAPPLNFEEENDSMFPSTVDWIVICMGYVSGIVVGIVIGHTITTRYHEWFIETFGRKQHKPRRQKRTGQGNRRVIVNSELARLSKNDNFCAHWNFMEWECSLSYG